MVKKFSLHHNSLHYTSLHGQKNYDIKKNDGHKNYDIKKIDGHKNYDTANSNFRIISTAYIFF